jgi:1-acyl-sn-glycerol-3-phosphate acyltransferase
VSAVAAALAAAGITVFARAVTGVRADWRGCLPQPGKRIYIANHVSHGDFVLIWTVLPRALRAATRPVAGADYWLASSARRFIASEVFNALLIERDPARRTRDPVADMAEVLQAGDALIFFPEGTRNTTQEVLLPFRSGLYHLCAAVPDAQVVPVWIDNLSRVMPKGEFLPVPLLCTVTFGEPLTLGPDEARDAFLKRTRDALLRLAPARHGDA